MKYLRGFLFILILLLLSFFIGMWVGSLSVDKHSGLAGGGIVFTSGILGAGAGLLTGFFLLYSFSARVIKRLTFVLGIVLLFPLTFFIMRAVESSREQEKQPPLRQITSPAAFIQTNGEFGLGFAKPNFYEKQALYFYNPNLEKSPMDTTPYDSVVFKQTELGFEISYAPPWLYPEHMKMDYEILFFKTTTLRKDWIEVEVNKQTKRKAWVSSSDVKFTNWHSFLLSTSTIEMIRPRDYPIRIKPMNHASPIAQQDYEFLRPVGIRDEWIEVEALDNDYKIIGQGWVRWKQDGQLLITYNLLS